VVQTVPNFRLVCPAATLFRDGQICENCVGHAPLAGILHACYHGSRVQTAAVAAMLAFHRLRGTWARDVDRFIALTEFARGKLIEGGLPAERIVVKPDFVYPDPGRGCGPRSGFAFIGRLVEEKGIDTAIDAWSTPGPEADLVVANKGPLENIVNWAAAGNPRIKNLGAIDRTKAMKLVRESVALIFPSAWYEPFGMAIIEAFAAGTPVIASRRGGALSLIEDGVTGLLFNPGDADDLRRKVDWAIAHSDDMAAMGQEARREYLEKYTGSRNHDLLLGIYEEALARDRQEMVTVR
jgi:glycosyltransferase involved in cell wall biosynthesis